ncbi:MAG: DUF2953 domain-containing protein [Lachnospiraceae bacterium]|nr:DUF2953 domain-containing protein [Lachnospiraceae bacterium]
MLKVLAIIGIVLGSLIVLALIILNIFLFVPFRYKIGGSNKDKLYFYFLMSFFLSFFRLKIYYKEEMGWASLRLFGIKIFDKKIPELIEFVEKLSEKFSKKEKKSEKGTEETAKTEEADLEADTIPETDTEEYTITEEEVEEFLNEPDEIDEMNALEKNITFLSYIKDFILNIKKKWYNFKRFVKEKIDQWNKTKKYIKYYWKVLNHPSVKPTLKLFWDLMIKFMKHVWPRKWRLKIKYGDEDPYLTGKVHGYICMARGLFGREIDFTPVWDENVFEFDGYVSGRVQLIVFLGFAFKVFANRHLRKLVILIIKGGKIRGRK